ncbi:ParA family partition ATPase [Tistrella bauzanensis]|uniref:ParA family partition ATPase n=1 Tax=Tistrella arctica TaxID=3133430 RepID=A0ABU9YD36_9PROT
MILTIAQQKGGAGKTTLAAQLAGCWAARGRRVAVVDIDDQGSLARWAAWRAERSPERPAVTARALSGWRLDGELAGLDRDHDVVIVDTPPEAENDARRAVRAADLVLVPVQPNPFDVGATRPTLDLARAEKRPVLLILNRVAPRAKLAQTMIDAVMGLGMPVADTRFANRTGFAASLVDGLSVVEAEPRSAAAREVEALIAEIEAAVSR